MSTRIGIFVTASLTGSATYTLKILDVDGGFFSALLRIMVTIRLTTDACMDSHSLSPPTSPSI
ncbi:ORF1301 [White spot syndrome virus]|uniref:ORF1301 n=1 Tax=White spot syndrome virus TaxID=342409 RepID=A0A2D3I755_9VIRU|nr:ORF1301 [White spot syndrome virus]